MAGGHTYLFVIKPWMIFILALSVFMFGLCAGYNKHVQRRKVASTTDRPGSISIDCGADEDYIDEESGIHYKSDSGFISTGENHNILIERVPTQLNPSLERMLSSLRSFPNGTKNCYNLKPEQGGGHNYMVRVFFCYGNYDRLFDSPRFDLYLGVNYWMTVYVRDDGQYHAELIQFFETDTIYVCLVNTGFGVPFISGLELRLLNNSIYRIPSKVIRPVARYDITVDSSDPNNFWEFRYEDDVYDRFWSPIMLSKARLINTSTNIDTQDNNNTYKIPMEVLRTAAQSLNGSDSLNYLFTLSKLLNSSNYSSRNLYVYFHFAEVVEITAKDQRREISIMLNGVKLTPIVLEYLKPRSMGPQTFPIKSYVNFSIDATAESDLPPILNAFEIYMDADFSTSPTNPMDADAIIAIKQIYKISRNEWQGDPCVPREYAWTGLNCSLDDSPRIISLNLSSSNLEGGISPALFNLTAIESLDLSNNKLTGPVPEFLAQLPILIFLNLSGNKFTGHIPLALMEKSRNGTLQLSISADKCQMVQCENRKKKIVVIVVSVVLVVALITLLSVLISICKLRRKQKEDSNAAWSVKSKNRPFPYSEIMRITANFTNVIGEGGFGKVYLGTLDDGTQVAVKVLSSSSRQGYKEFQAEAQLLMIVHHKNLVSLVGYCDEDGNQALVYEYMANGNLKQHLSDENMNVLSWKERLRIAVDAAYGLEYLHNGCKPPIVHRDLKTPNILLTQTMQAKIADFGLSRVFMTESASHISTRPAGTPGYLDPESHASRNINKKSDVYSFGVILLELITGQPVIIRGEEYNTHIIEWVRPAVEAGDIQSIIDPRLQGEFNINIVWKTTELSMSCVSPTANQRPDVSHVLVELKECLAIEMPPQQPQRMQNEMEVSHNSVEITTLTPR